MKYNPISSTTKYIFPNKKQIDIQFTKNHAGQSVVDFSKNHVPPKVNHAIYLDPDSLHQPTCELAEYLKILLLILLSVIKMSNERSL